MPHSPKASDWQRAVDRYCDLRDREVLAPGYARRTRRILTAAGRTLSREKLACDPADFDVVQLRVLLTELWTPATERTRGYSFKTVTFFLAVLNRFLVASGSHGIIPLIRRDPGQAWLIRQSFTTSSRVLPRLALDEGQVARLIRSSKRLGILVEAVVALELTMGLRRSEVLRLKVNQIQQDPAHVLGKGKLGGRWREVPRSAIVKRLLPRLLAQRSRAIRKGRGPDPGYLICHLQAGRIRRYSTTWADSCCMIPAFREAGIRLPGNLHHALRRTYGRRVFRLWGG